MFKSLFFLFFSFSLFSQEELAEKLLLLYGGTCQSGNGLAVQDALNDSTRLIGLLEELRDGDDCNGLSNAISSLSSMSEQLNNISISNGPLAQLNKLEKKEHLITTELTQVEDTERKSLLRQNLYNVQDDIIDIRSSISGDKIAYHRSTGLALERFARIAESSFTGLRNNSTCLMNKPDSLAAIGSLVGSVGSVVSMMNPILSYGIQSTSELIGEVVKTARKLKIQK